MSIQLVIRLRTWFYCYWETVWSKAWLPVLHARGLLKSDSKFWPYQSLFRLAGDLVQWQLLPILSLNLHHYELIFYVKNYLKNVGPFLLDYSLNNKDYTTDYMGFKGIQNSLKVNAFISYVCDSGWQRNMFCNALENKKKDKTSSNVCITTNDNNINSKERFFNCFFTFEIPI